MVKVKKSGDSSQQNSITSEKERENMIMTSSNSTSVTGDVEKSGKKTKRVKKGKKYRAKLKKQKKAAKLNKLQNLDAESKDGTDCSASQLAIDYLRHWKNDRESWGFKKVRQVWLLKHIYDETVITAQDFSTLVEYLEGLKGQSRDATLAEAQAVLKAYDNQEEGESTEKVTEEKHERACKIMQIL